MAVIALAACRDRKRGDKEAVSTTGAGEAANPASAHASPTPTPPDPFAAKIAAHLDSVPDPRIVYTGDADAAAGWEHQAFRDQVISFVRLVATGGDTVSCGFRFASRRPFKVSIWPFLEGAIVGHGQAIGDDLCVALQQATRRAMASMELDRQAFARARLVVELPDHKYALVEHRGKGVELSHGLVPVRVFDKKLLAERIQQGKAYLRRTIDAEHNGVHKYYYAPTDSFEDKLHTIYTASTVFTLLQLHAYDGDKSLLTDIERAARFLLSMQSRDPRERSHGGFFYSYDLNRQRASRKLVVGTTSKTIFTLLKLHAATGDDTYMEAATLAADWLMSMQNPNGSIRSYMRQESNGRWVFASKESMLYTGQALSAFSRMYGATGEPRYRHAATQTADYLSSLIAQRGCYLGDDYRKPNPISSSWAILSLLDYVKATDDPQARDLLFGCADELLGRQIRNQKDVYRYGRWQRSLSSSGNGWLAEVMSELYLYCRQNEMDGCERFEEAIVRVLRLLMQYTYTPESSFVVKNPQAALGGVFWNVAERYVRTDSVCHAMNAYIYMMPYLDDDTLISLPEPPLAERLALARAAPAGDAAGESDAALDEAEDERDDDEVEDQDQDEDQAEETEQAVPAPAPEPAPESAGKHPGQ